MSIYRVVVGAAAPRYFWCCADCHVLSSGDDDSDSVHRAFDAHLSDAEHCAPKPPRPIASPTREGIA